MVVVLVVGTTIGLIWADTSDVAGVIALVTNIVSVVGIMLLLIALAVVTRRQRQTAPREADERPDASESRGVRRA